MSVGCPSASALLGGTIGASCKSLECECSCSKNTALKTVLKDTGATTCIVVEGVLEDVTAKDSELSAC